MFKAYYNLLLYLKAIMWKQQLYGFYPIVLNRPQLLCFSVRHHSGCCRLPLRYCDSVQNFKNISEKYLSYSSGLIHCKNIIIISTVESGNSKLGFVTNFFTNERFLLFRKFA